MIPLIKIRLHKIRADPILQGFLYTLPLIYVTLFLFFVYFIIGLRPEVVPEEYFPSLVYSIFELNVTDAINTGFYFSTGKYAVISEDLEIRNKMIQYFYTLKTTKTFSNYSSYDEYLEKIDFSSLNPHVAFEINKNKDNEYQCQIYTNVFDQNSFLNSYDTLAQLDKGILPTFYSAVFSQLLMYIEQKPITTNYNIKYMTFGSAGGTNSLLTLIDRYQNGILIELLISLFFSLLPFFYYFTCISMMLWMVEEKEQKLTLFLNRQGMKIKSYILSWFFTFCILSVPVALIMVTLLNLFFFVGVNFFWLISTFLLFLISTFSYSFFFHSLLEKSQEGSSISKLLYIALCIFSSIVNGQNFPNKLRAIFLLFPQINIYTNLIILFQIGGINIDFSTKIMSPTGGVSIFTSYLLFLVSSILFFTLGLIIMKYKNSGLSLLEFVFCSFSNKKSNRPELIFEAEQDGKSQLIIEDNHLHQKPNKYQSECQANKTYLHIDKVTKKYGELIAVNQFEGDLYPGEIFCLLGHNGAGKTTLIKMISGEEEPDNGDIYMDNISLSTNKNYLFQNIGVCSQENILFDYLTVRQHLSLMYGLKGTEANDKEVDELIIKLGLSINENVLAKYLSGGEKRKLCIALALIGQSKLILLDEPTSGMDVISRKALWNFLKDYRHNKIIILTTHSIDEAEFLGDRIGIMLEGQYYCSGTSTFLKSKVPGGYTINLILDSSKFTKEMVHQLFTELNTVDQSVEIKYQSMFMLSLYFKVLNEKVNDVFLKIKELRSNYPILNYTVSSTTLEEVFLSVNVAQEDPKNNIVSLNDTNNISEEDNLLVVARKQPLSCCGQIGINIKRHFISFWRNKLTFLLELLSSFMLLIIIFFIFFLSYLTITQVTQRNFTDLLEIDDHIKYKFFEGTTIDDIKTSYYYRSTNPNVDFKSFDIETTDIDPDAIISKNDGQMIRNSIFLHKFENDTFLSIGTSVSNKFVFHADMNILLSYLFEKDYGIKASLSPVIKFIPQNEIFSMENKKILALICVFFFHITLISFGTYILINPIKERQNNFTHLYYLSGGNMLSYWISNFITDFMKYLILIILSIPVFIYLESLSWYTVILYIVFIISNCLYTYMFSFMFNKPENGSKVYMAFNILVFIIGPLFTQSSWTSMISEYNFSICEIFPFTTLFTGVVTIDFLFEIMLFDIFTYKLFIFGIQIIIFSIIIILCEKKFFEKCCNCLCCRSGNDAEFLPLFNGVTGNYYQNLLANNKVRDYNMEQRRKIEMDQESKLTVKIWNLSKTFYSCCCCCCCYRSVTAVKNLYIGLEKNEKLGLLGFNGSGKTTTFKSITNELLFDGKIKIFGYNIATQFKEIRKSIGYCPQENALFDHLTVKDTLLYFQKLRNVDLSIDYILEKYDLLKYKNTITTKLSGGNKRKLSFAIALIDDSELLLLDEPSTGVDPKSRRKMWENINKLSINKNFNMILSTHSMEEAEILCDTVSWLKCGRLVCFGNPEKLKLEYSMGYKFHIKFNEPEQECKDDLVTQNNVIKQVSTVYQIPYELCDNYVKSNPKVFVYLKKILAFYGKIDTKLNRCILIEIRRDFSFEILLNIIEEQQSELFAQVLTMKENNLEIAELTISMVGLEDLFTKL